MAVVTKRRRKIVCLEQQYVWYIKEDERCQDYTKLFFQYDLTSEDEWEADTFVFFIKPEDLAACRFEDMMEVKEQIDKNMKLVAANFFEYLDQILADA